MGDACRALGTPVTGGNVSLYNENPQGAVFPTPTIGMVGLILDLAHITRSTFRADGDAIVLLGENTAELGASEYLARIHGLTIGAVPAVDLDHERRLVDALLEAIASGTVHSAHDCSEGGLAVALAESCISERTATFGAHVDIADPLVTSSRALLFGEAQGRVIVSTRDAPRVIAVATAHGVPARVIGHVTATQRLVIGTGAHTLDTALEPLVDAFFDAIPALMQRAATASA
jgi:phosphoribosylformylglycinamidine synthase